MYIDFFLNKGEKNKIYKQLFVFGTMFKLISTNFQKKRKENMFVESNSYELPFVSTMLLLSKLLLICSAN